MNNTSEILGVNAFAWALLTLSGFVTMVFGATIRNYDVYDIQVGMRALNEQPVLVIGGQIAFAWAGVVLVLMALGFYEWLPAASRSYTTRVATTFGIIAGALFLFFGLVGSHGTFDRVYIQSVRSAAYGQEAYLPLTLVMNRTQAAAITVSGLWFALTNWVALRSRVLPRLVSYIGLGAGVAALLGFVLPGGGFSLLGLLLSALWGILVGFRLLPS
jgi:hypothetical protein